MSVKKKNYTLSEDLIRPWSTFVPKQAAIEVSKTLKSKWINTGVKEKELREKLVKNGAFATVLLSPMGLPR